MKALVYHGPGRKSWQDVPDPQIVDPTDAVVDVTTVTICGTDLHILKGDVPTVAEGRILGHEAVGTVRAVGSAVTNVQPGDHVLVSCISACGRCSYCRRGSYGQCLGGGGWILGHLVDGVQAEQVRVPFADTSTYRIDSGYLTNQEAIAMTDQEHPATIIVASDKFRRLNEYIAWVQSRYDPVWSEGGRTIYRPKEGA